MKQLQNQYKPNIYNQDNEYIKDISEYYVGTYELKEVL